MAGNGIGAGWFSSIGRWSRSLLPLVLGSATTVVFFAVVSVVCRESDYLFRYTMGHPVNMTEVWLFFWGICEGVLKYKTIRRESSALYGDYLPASNVPVQVTEAQALLDHLKSKPKKAQQSLLGNRIAGILQFVRDRQSSDAVDDQLRYLAEGDADEAHGSYSLLRLIAWMIPILGFLGTVLGITMAIANVSPSELETSLGKVTGGLAVAFDTTGVALILSMILMFMIFLLERTEQRVLAQIERRAEREVAHRFSRGLVDFPGQDVIRAASEAVIGHSRKLGEILLDQTGIIVERQSEIWTQALVGWQQQMRVGEQQQFARFEKLAEMLNIQWSKQLELTSQITQQMMQVEKQLGILGDRLERISQESQLLIEVEDKLGDNLATLQQTQSLDHAVNSLTAAVHLLTSRSQPLIRGDRKAG